jgi:TfoX/Sxy family transcriptional regulator of competence genes
MKKWQPCSPELVARFDACLPKAVGVERRKMFGYPCAFVNGNMFTGVHEQRLIVRLDAGRRAELLKKTGTAPFVVMGKAMREYVMFADALAHTPREISTWMKQALDYAQALPPKKKPVRASARAGAKAAPATTRTQPNKARRSA